MFYNGAMCDTQQQFVSVVAYIYTASRKFMHN